MSSPFPPRPKGQTPDKTGTPDEPWLTRDAITRIEKILTPSMKVLELGSGGSTVWFAQRVSWVDTVEYDLSWMATVANELARRQLQNVRVSYAPPDHDYKEYVELVGRLAREKGPYQFVLVDGRRRVRCVDAIRAHLPPGCVLVLDNSDRDQYAPIREMLSGWERTETSNGIWRTDIYRKVN